MVWVLGGGLVLFMIGGLVERISHRDGNDFYLLGYLMLLGGAFLVG